MEGERTYTGGQEDKRTELEMYIPLLILASNELYAEAKTEYADNSGRAIGIAKEFKKTYLKLFTATYRNIKGHSEELGRMMTTLNSPYTRDQMLDLFIEYEGYIDHLKDIGFYSLGASELSMLDLDTAWEEEMGKEELKAHPDRHIDRGI